MLSCCVLVCGSVGDVDKWQCGIKWLSGSVECVVCGYVVCVDVVCECVW